MRIGFSFVDLAMGGAQTFLVQLANGLARRGHAIFYYLYAEKQDRMHTNPSLLNAISLAAEPVKRPGGLLSCQVIQLDGYHSIRRKLPYMRKFNRCVETYHSRYSLRRSGPIYPNHRVAVSQVMLEMIHGRGTLIPTGIPIPEPCVDQEKEFDLAILGRIHPVKQHLLFLQACEKIFQQRGALQVAIIGGHPKSGPYQETVDRQILKLRETGLQIHLSGDIDYSSVFTWLCKSRLLMVTSKSEGFGRMAVEAMACGLPVIANPVGGLLEIIDQDQSGYFAAKNDPESFASLGLRLLDQPRLARKLGNYGREVAEKRFSLEAVILAYEKLYRKIANQ